MIIVFIAAEAKVLAQRLKGRGDSMDNIRRRLQISATESGSLQNYDYVLINNEVKQTAMQLFYCSGIPKRANGFWNS